MKRKLFCEICPFTYWLSGQKNIIKRKITDVLAKNKFAITKSEEKLPFVIYEHKSEIMRVLYGVNMRLQENKKINLSIATPKVNGVLIYPGEIFSFWKLVGKCTVADGYREGLVISNSKTEKGIGGGMCQFTNLIHWMVLHSPLEIVEHHHHEGVDLFPDCNRTVPFGTGTSVAYNYIDYRVKNNTDKVFQLIVYLNDTHLCGELRSTSESECDYVVNSEKERFVQKKDGVYREGQVYRTVINKKTNEVILRECICNNSAKVMYDIGEIEAVNSGAGDNIPD